MILSILIYASILLFPMEVDCTNCFELQQSQLIALNNRMKQMIDTISSLLPESLKKLAPPVQPSQTPSANYVPSTTGRETSYYVAPSAYPTLSPTPPVMYIPPSYIPMPIAVTTPMHPNPISTSIYQCTPAETGLQPEYPFSDIPYLTPQIIKNNYKQPPQYSNPISKPLLLPSSYQLSPYPLIESPPPEYIHTYENPVSGPMYPNYSAYPPGLPLIPLPVQVPPSAYIPRYPK